MDAEKVTVVYVDRCEEGQAVLLLGESAEQMEQFRLPKKLLPQSVSDGDYIRLAISYDADATQKEAAEVAELLKEVDG